MVYFAVAALIVVAALIASAVQEKSRQAFIASLDESTEYDIILLWKNRAVLPRATGQGRVTPLK